MVPAALAGDLKHCGHCKEEKDLTQFFRNRAQAGGYGNYCKVCAKTACTKWYRANPEKAKAGGKAWLAANRQRDRENKRRWLAENKEHELATRRKKYWEKPEEFRAKRKQQVFKTFGLTEAEYLAILASQNGVCATCKLPPKTKRLHIDHCHKTGKNRELLCSKCNTGIGLANDSPELLRTMADYVEKHQRRFENEARK